MLPRLCRPSTPSAECWSCWRRPLAGTSTSWTATPPRSSSACGTPAGGTTARKRPRITRSRRAAGPRPPRGLRPEARPTPSWRHGVAPGRQPSPASAGSVPCGRRPKAPAPPACQCCAATPARSSAWPSPQETDSSSPAPPTFPQHRSACPSPSGTTASACRWPTP